MPSKLSAIDTWNAAWDDEAGLWWQESPGHTATVSRLARVRPIPSAASRLLLAAEAGMLPDIPATRVISAIADAQVRDEGPHRGCFKWYYEEAIPSDTNAAFFTGMSLIALRLTHFNELTEVAQSMVTVMLNHLQAWFQRAVRHLAPNYANKCLGDLVCCWLLMEINGVDDEDNQVRKAMLDAASYWNHHHWGWGEHMSDTYAAICLDELSMLLLMSKSLPPDVRVAYQRLFDQLLSLEDQFDDGPRVPAIRSYAFTTSPAHHSYRENILPIDTTHSKDLQLQPSQRLSVLTQFSNRPPLASVLAHRGWHESALTRHARGHEIRVPCFGGATAVSHVERTMRLGTLSRFPIMPGTDHRQWGLSWQSFPVAFWRPEGDWGFLQWETRSGTRTRAHPAEDKSSSYLDNALAHGVNPPAVGRTFAIQQGGDAIILRLMPVIPVEWDNLHDRFRLIDGRAEIVDSVPKPVLHTLYWHQRQLIYDGRTVSIQCLPLVDGVKAESFKRETFDQRHAQDWDVIFERARLAHLRCVPIVWGISVNGQVLHPPVVQVVHDPSQSPRNDEERILQIHWEWDSARWDVTVDPLADEPLKEV